MFQDLINEALETGRPYIKEGEVATYIPELGRADKNKLGISIFCRDGSRFSCGDTKDRFSIQSISKVISLAVALEVCGFDMVFENVGMEPSGDAFNSLIKLEGSNSHPYNPMINSGAIAVASFIEPKVSFGEMLELARCFCQDDGIVLDEKVYRSEMSTVARNRAIAYLLESKGVINGNVEEALDFYVKMCSLSVTAESGTQAAKDTVLATYCPKGAMRLICSVDEQDIAEIQVGDVMTVTLDAYEDKPLRGVVTKIAAAGEDGGAFYDVTLELEENDIMRIGMSASAEK